MQTSLDASEIEMLIIKDYHPVNNSLIQPAKESVVLDPSQNEFHLLDEQQTLEEINTRFTQHHLVSLVYEFLFFLSLYYFFFSPALIFTWVYMGNVFGLFK